jgi:hypothetical protein
MKELKVVSDPLNHLILNRMFHLHLNTMSRHRQEVSIDLYKNMINFEISPDYLDKELHSPNTKIAKVVYSEKLKSLNLFDKDIYPNKVKGG